MTAERRAPRVGGPITPGRAPRVRTYVEDVMQTDVTSVTPSTPLDIVVARMLERGLRFVPVCEGDRLVGVITNGDLVERGGLVARLELAAALGAGAPLPPAAGVTAGEVMTSDPIAVLVGTSVGDVARLMLTRRVKRIPVLKAGRVAGVVSRFDLLRSVAGAEESGLPGSTSPGSTVVSGDAAVHAVPTVHPGTSLVDVLDVLVSTRLNRAVVVDDDRHVVGVVSDAELLRAIGPAGAHLLDRLMRRAGRVPHLAGVCADVMTPAPGVVRASAPVGEAIAEMIARKAKIVPVVDDEQRLVGLLDRADALRAAFPSPPRVD